MESLTVVEAAERLGVTRATVYSWFEAGRLRRLADGRVPAAEIERLTSDWRAELDTAKTGIQVADALEHMFRKAEVQAHGALVEACALVVREKGKGAQDAIDGLEAALRRHRAITEEVYPMVRGAREGAAEFASAAMRKARGAQD